MTISRQLAQPILDAYFDGIGRLLGRRERRVNFALYAMGLLSKLERKSLEPIAALAAGDDPQVSAKLYDHLLNFTSDSPWSDEAVRSYAAAYALPRMLAQGPMDVWVIDDTGFLKQGTHSVGVKRQYTGSAGKIANCQVAVSLTIATSFQHLPLDIELYLPEEWIDDRERRAEAKIPEEVAFRTKPEMALDMIARWMLQDVPKGSVSADSGYGYDGKFRGGLTQMGLQYTVGVHETLKVLQVGEDGTLGVERSVAELARSLPREAYKKVAWVEGTKKTLSSRFALVRVQVAHPDSAEPEEQGLLIEWPRGQKGPEHYTLVTLPKETPLKEVVRKTKARWHVEGSYEDMKGELGLDHFEGRSWIGWNHHTSIVLACYALTIACKMRAFPPSAAGTVQGGEDGGEDGAALHGLVRDGATGAAPACGAVAEGVLCGAAHAGQDAAGLQGEAA
jgi:SRSO17 transposase